MGKIYIDIGVFWLKFVRIQIFVIAVLPRSVLRVARPISEIERLANTASKKHRCGGEPLPVGDTLFDLTDPGVELPELPLRFQCIYPLRQPAALLRFSCMATAGQDRRIRIFDLRTYKPVYTYKVRGGASNLDFSQKGLLAATCQKVVDVYKDPCVQVRMY